MVDIRQTVERFPPVAVQLPDDETRVEPKFVYGAPFNYNANHTRWDNVVDNVEITYFILPPYDQRFCARSFWRLCRSKRQRRLCKHSRQRKCKKQNCRYFA